MIRPLGGEHEGDLKQPNLSSVVEGKCEERGVRQVVVEDWEGRLEDVSFLPVSIFLSFEEEGHADG